MERIDRDLVDMIKYEEMGRIDGNLVDMMKYEEMGSRHENLAIGFLKHIFRTL